MPADAAVLVVVRQALGGLALALGLDAARRTDIQLAVTEACANVVRHAYVDQPIRGKLEVDATVADTTLTIVVRDYGPGVRPRPPGSNDDGGGVGLPLMASLSDHLEIRQGGGASTEVAMTFLLERDRSEL